MYRRATAHVSSSARRKTDEKRGRFHRFPVLRPLFGTLNRVQPRVANWYQLTNSASRRHSLANLQQPLRLPEDPLHHRRRQLARVRVLPARMVAADERGQAVAELHDLAVPELRPRRWRHAAPLQQLQSRIEADLAERDDDANAAQVGELDLQVIEAARDLFRQRLVVGRRASHGRQDVCVGEMQSIIGMS